MEIVYHSLGNLDRLSGYADAMVDYLDEVSRPDTTVELRGTPKGGLADTYRFFSFQDAHGVAATIASERDRVDAIAVGNILDPAVREGRTITDIPILGLGETSYLTACSVAESAAVIPLTPEWEPQLRDRIRMYDLSERIPVVRGMDIGLERMADAFYEDDKRQQVLDGFEAAVVDCVEQGVELVIPGGGIISMLLNQEGITELHGVPVMDQVSVLVKLTEAYVDLYELGALQTSEKRMFARPANIEELLDEYDLG
ncbi:MAG: aspartate/glutamate racemase family protein [Salinirussus sp.]